MSILSPLSEKMRPKTLADIVGQKHLFDPAQGILFRILKRKKPVSLVFWGPPGCGKTTIAKLYLNYFQLPHESLHSTTSQTADFKKVIERAYSSPLFRPTLIWIDEVHRLTRPQQDLLLPCIEDGSIVLVAATTENPSFQLSRALLSRVQVVTLHSLSTEDLLNVLQKVEETCGTLPLTDEAKTSLCAWSCGDARILLNWIEKLQGEEQKTMLSGEEVAKLLEKRSYGTDPTGEGRYQMISALHKAVRGSDCQGALYWLCRMIASGEDLLYLARRVIRMAVEDVGLADPTALTVALNAKTTYETLGSPEGELAIAEAVVFLALSPKSNAVYNAYKACMREAEKTMHHAVPHHLVNAATSWMEKEGFGKGYVYEHDLDECFSGQRFFPEGVEEKEYYIPVDRGFERELLRRIVYFKRLKTSG